jgi:hypothetical protein
LKEEVENWLHRRRTSSSHHDNWELPSDEANDEWQCGAAETSYWDHFLSNKNKNKKHPRDDDSFDGHLASTGHGLVDNLLQAAMDWSAASTNQRIEWVMKGQNIHAVGIVLGHGRRSAHFTRDGMPAISHFVNHYLTRQI